MTKKVTPSKQREINMNRQPASGYSPIHDSLRLLIQSQRVELFDRSIVDGVIKTLSSDHKPVRILDVGCADGTLTYSRFSQYRNVLVTGIDLCQASIKKASSNNSDPRFKYFQCDIENDVLEFDEYDFIFCSYLTPHLRNPSKVLQRLWTFLGMSGILYVRSGDDGWKVTYPSSKDLDLIMQYTQFGQYTSDRAAGRKIYGQLKSLSPKPLRVKMEMSSDSTAGMENSERRAFFDQYFSFRSYYVEQELKRSEKNEKLQALYQKLIEAIARERERFTEDAHLFSVTFHIVGIAQKGSYERQV